MGTYQYRVSVENAGTSGFGFAYFVLVNPSGSGRKLTVKSLEAFNHTGVGTIPYTMTLIRSSINDITTGEDITYLVGKADSTTTIPSTFKFYRLGSCANLTDKIMQFQVGKQHRAGGSGLSMIPNATPVTIGSRRRRLNGYNIGFGSAPEGIFIRQNEAISFHVNPTALCYSNPIRLAIALSIDGKTVVYDVLTNAIPGMNVVTITNTGTEAIKILNIATTDVGTTDTPTLRVVPVGQMYGEIESNDAFRGYTILKMDSDYPDPPSNMKLYIDVPFLPYGVPESAISDASGGSPKFMNYLHTKDFQGPIYRTALVEPAAWRGAGQAVPDDFGFTFAFSNADLLCRRAGITINPGEGIAIANTAETAVGSITAGWGGWVGLSFGLQVSDSPVNVPVISTSGVVNGSRWSLERVSNGSQVASGVVTDGTINYTYTTEDTPLNLRLKIRKATSAPYYQPYEVTFNLTSAGITLPAVSQVADE